MDSTEFKKYIYRNNLIQDLLEKIGCHSFVFYDKDVRCALPDDNDNSKVSIQLDENLNTRIFTKGETIFGSIYDLIMHIENTTFKDAFKKYAALLGVGVNNSLIKKHDDPLAFFKKIRKKKEEKAQNQTYGLSLLNKYSPIPHIDLIRKDGIIDEKILKKYRIMFDERTERIIFPHFKYDDKSKIVGIIGRTVNPDYELLDIPKYFSMEGIEYKKGKNLYGLSHNVENIKKEGKVIVFEAEKSVLKADMFDHPIGVAVGSHDLSNFQIKLLISLNVEIIIAFDKGVDNSHILKIANKLNKYRKVSYIIDDWQLLNDKDSPVDRGYKKWRFLYKHRKYI